MKDQPNQETATKTDIEEKLKAFTKKFSNNTAVSTVCVDLATQSIDASVESVKGPGDHLVSLRDVDEAITLALEYRLQIVDEVTALFRDLSELTEFTDEKDAYLRYRLTATQHEGREEQVHEGHAGKIARLLIEKYAVPREVVSDSIPHPSKDKCAHFEHDKHTFILEAI